MNEQAQRDLAATLRALEEAAPRLYSRWSAKAWRLACAGPATRLWTALADTPDGGAALEDYLFLLREAIGMQYLAATRAEDLEPGAPAHGFLAVMLCETLPRLLPSLPAASRGRVLAQVWNVGEKLVGKPVWLDRYLAARLPELGDLSRFDEFLALAVGEGLDDLPPARFEGARRVSIADPSRVDRAFLPGAMHLATPSVVCVHDRRRESRHVALLLRRTRDVVCLGATPCLGHDGDRAGAAPQGFINAAAGETVREPLSVIAAAGGFCVFTHALSQRVWVVESER
ncbi:MAG TPA: hypothetical protein VMV18_09635 [bacterium]|nr:hypothetical protein [bacterium]